MKATRFAVLLFLCVLSFQISAVEENIVANSSPPIEANLARLNINTVDVLMLSGSIKGLGKKRAQAIINYRDVHGPFKSIEELSHVKGVGKSFVKHNIEKLQATFAVD